jgi:hypothetical protein
MCGMGAVAGRGGTRRLTIVHGRVDGNGNAAGTPHKKQYKNNSLPISGRSDVFALH